MLTKHSGRCDWGKTLLTHQVSVDSVFPIVQDGGGEDKKKLKSSRYSRASAVDSLEDVFACAARCST